MIIYLIHKLFISGNFTYYFFARVEHENLELQNSMLLDEGESHFGLSLYLNLTAVNKISTTLKLNCLHYSFTIYLETEKQTKSRIQAASKLFINKNGVYFPNVIAAQPA